MKINKIIIPYAKDIYRFKSEFYSYELKYSSKNQYYFNTHELTDESINMLCNFLNENQIKYEWKETQDNDFIKEIEFFYKLDLIDNLNFFIQKRKNNRKLYYINLTGKIINILDLRNSKNSSIKINIKDYEDINLPMFVLKALSETNQNDFSELQKILSVLINYNSEEYKFESRLNAFKFHIFGIVKSKNQNDFLCNCVEGFYPETKFYIRGSKIYSDYLGHEVSKEQEKKILKYLFLNRNFIGVYKEPTFKDLFLSKSILVNTKDGFTTKMPISYVKTNPMNKKIAVTVYDGRERIKLAKELTVDELYDLVKYSRG
jgi:hypothetical protein